MRKEAEEKLKISHQKHKSARKLFGVATPKRKDDPQ